MTNHASDLGTLVSNFQSLELIIRVYLYTIDNSSMNTQQNKDLMDLVEGDEIEDNALTNYDSLNNLIDRFNHDMKIRNSMEYALNKKLVRLRDLIAHGRVLGKVPDMNRMKLFKFEKPKNGKVIVSDSVVMSDHWYAENITLLKNEIRKIETVFRKNFPDILKTRITN